MKNRLFACLAAMTCALSATSYAGYYCADGLYVGGFGGVNFLTDVKDGGLRAEFDPGYLVGADLGYQINDNFRVEGEFSFRHNSMDKIKYHRGSEKPHAHVDTYALMANGYWDINMGYCLVPYVGVGVGYAWHEGRAKAHHDTFVAKSRGVAGQVMVGAQYQLDEIKLGAEYRFFKSKEKVSDHALVFNISRSL